MYLKNNLFLPVVAVPNGTGDKENYCHILYQGFWILTVLFLRFSALEKPENSCHWPAGVGYHAVIAVFLFLAGVQ